LNGRSLRSTIKGHCRVVSMAQMFGVDKDDILPISRFGRAASHRSAG
jgi:hypothetical protein